MSILAPKTEQRATDVLAQCLPYFELLANLKMTREDDIDAKQAENCLRRILGDTIPRRTEVPIVDSALFIEHLYVLIRWPWVQELMEYDWFRPECCLHQAFDDQEYLDSAYFVPLTRLSEINQPG